MTKYKIVKTQGTKESVGAFMVFDEKNEEVFDGTYAYGTHECICFKYRRRK